MLRCGINCKWRATALAIYMKRAICHFDLLIRGTSILNPPILSSIFIDKFSRSFQPSSCCHLVVTHTSDHKPASEHLTLRKGEERGELKVGSVSWRRRCRPRLWYKLAREVRNGKYFSFDIHIGTDQCRQKTMLPIHKFQMEKVAVVSWVPRA